jgi:hypothetical protein
MSARVKRLGRQTKRRNWRRGFHQRKKSGWDGLTADAGVSTAFAAISSRNAQNDIRRKSRAVTERRSPTSAFGLALERQRHCCDYCARDNSRRACATTAHSISMWTNRPRRHEDTKSILYKILRVFVPSWLISSAETAPTCYAGVETALGVCAAETRRPLKGSASIDIREAVRPHCPSVCVARQARLIRCKRLRLTARHTTFHSPRALAMPRRLKRRTPRTSLIQPITGSTIALRRR